jgi:hypothetical protein
MPYGLVALIVGAGLTVCFVLTSEASLVARAIVGGLFVLTLVLEYSTTGWSLAGLLLQVILSIALILYFKFEGYGSPPANP